MSNDNMIYELSTAQTPRSSDFPWKIAGFEVVVGLRQLLATEQSVSKN